MIEFSKKKRTMYLTISIVLLFCVFLYAGNACAEGLNEKSSLFLETTISVPVKFELEAPNPSLEYLLINYTWIPKNDYRQKLISSESIPTGKISDTSLEIRYTQLKDFELNVVFNTFSSSQRLIVNDKIMFPIKGLNSSLVKYTMPSEKIDINEDIKRQASELAAGEDDLYVVVFKLADWVNSNIAYNLSSATADASLSSSWVLKNRYGVCDELSNLFISMCRSLGIPARFVSGIAYSNDPQFENEWGAHGWVEVYFPRYGWIPFDPTYNQLGYVDATHIKFDDQKEGSKDALMYTWLGRGVDVTSGKIKIDSEVISENDMDYDDFSINIDFMKKNIGFNSYNVVEAVVKNNRNYYVSTSLALARTDGTQIITNERQDILLLPNEQKTIYWIIKINDLSRQYIYTFPMSVYSFDEQDTEEFEVSSSGQKISLKAAENYISESKIIVEGPEFVCNASKNTIYEGETATISCSAESYNSWTFCMEEKCIAEKFITIEKNITLMDVGFTTIQLSASSAFGGPKSYEFLGFNVLDEANVSMNISSSDRVKFSEKGNIYISLFRESSNIPQNAKLKIENNFLFQEWKFENLEERKNFELGFEGKNLKNGINTFNVILEYDDELGKKYSISENVSIELYGLTFFQKIYVWFNGVLLSI